MANGEYVVVSLGGSLISLQEGIDTEFIRDFCAMIRTFVSDGYRFVIITGGGHVTREYQRALQEIREVSREDVDWVGVYVTHLHAQLIRLSLDDIASGSIITDPTDAIDTSSAVVVGGGWKPGWSTDYDAVLVADQVGAEKIINLSNIEYVYDKDPREHADAVPIREITWERFRKLLPEKWTPGSNTPFDPIAAQEAEQRAYTVVSLYGRDLTRFSDYLKDGSVTGTIITP